MLTQYYVMPMIGTNWQTRTVSFAQQNAVWVLCLLLAESSTVLTRTPNLLFTVTLVFSIRVTFSPSGTMYASGSKNTPATANKDGREPGGEQMGGFQSKQAYSNSCCVEPEYINTAHPNRMVTWHMCMVT